MGILDDAIREHLELKRKHGMPEDELQRQEEEALGPARRDVAHQPEEAEMTAGATATAEAEHDEPSAAADEAALFDMEVQETEAQEAEHEEPPAVEHEEPAAVAPVVDQPPGGMEPPEPAEPEPEPEHTEPTSVEPPPVEPPPAPAESRPYLGDTEPHGFEAVDQDEDLDEDQAVVEDKALDEDEDEGEDEAEDPDVLEDTPDFLQETPEHDRLWFEQKPPRDFDFD
jgi:hypothetical protein